MSKIIKYIGIALALALVSFLIYRFVYTRFTGPSDEQLQEEKKLDDEVVAPSKLDALEASFDEDSTASDTTSH